MSLKTELLGKIVKNKQVKKFALLVLMENRPDVSRMLQTDFGLGAVVPRKIPPRSKQTIAELELQARVIGDFMRLHANDTDYPVVDTEGIMYYYQDKINKLCEISGLTKEEQDEHIITHVRNLASCVHLIPASGESHHRCMGGLFEHSIETACIAAKYAKESVFPSEEAALKAIPRNRWVAGAILGSLFHDLGKVMVNVDVYITEPKKETFDPYAQELTPWLLEHLGFGSKYHVKWIARGDAHKKRTQTMLYSRLVINPKTQSWLGKTVYKEVSRYWDGELDSKYRKLIHISDGLSAKESLQHGQFQNVPGNTPEEIELEVAFETMWQMLNYGRNCQGEDGEPEEFEMNGVKFRGWSINTPKSAVVYADINHLYIIWEDFMQMRFDYEAGQRESGTLDLNISCSDIGSAAWDHEFCLLAQKLKDNNYLQTYSSKGSGDERVLWEVRRIDQETGELGVALNAICFNGLGIRKIFKNNKRPPTSPHLLSVTGGTPVEIKEEVPPEAEKTQEVSSEPEVQEPAADEPAKVEVASTMPPDNKKKPDSKDHAKDKKPEPEGIIEEGTHDPPKKTFANYEGIMTYSEGFEAFLWERVSPSGMACIVNKGGVTYVTGESVNELCKRHGLTVNELKLQIRLLEPYGEYLYFEEGSDALIYKEKKYYRKSKLAENVAN